MAHLAELTLVSANRDQVILSRKRQSTEWGRGLSEKQFLAGEEQLENLEHAADGKLTIWVLVPRDDPQTMNFCCSCETFRRSALMLKPSSNQPEEITAYAIASVFCPPEYRRRGYASHMMRLLHHVLSPELQVLFPSEWGTAPTPHPGARDARFSVLYSDVGELYARCGASPDSFGWQFRSPIGTLWPLQPKITNVVDDSDVTGELLTEEQCRKLWDTDAQYITNSLSSLPPSSRTRFTFLPNKGVAAFQLRRAEFYLANFELFPKHWGIAIPQKEGTPPVYATWTLDASPLQPTTLVVTRLRATPESLPALVRELVAAARRHDASAVEAWNVDTGLVDTAASLGAKTGPREEHLPAVAWYGPEDPDEVEWVFNEKFPWC